VELLGQLHKAFDDLLFLAKKYNEAADLGGSPKIPFPKGPVVDFMAAMHRSFDQWARLSDILQEPSDKAINDVAGLLGTLNNSIDQAYAAAGESPRAQSKSSNAGTFKPFETIVARANGTTWTTTLTLRSDTLDIHIRQQGANSGHVETYSIALRHIRVGPAGSHWIGGWGVTLSCNQNANQYCIPFRHIPDVGQERPWNNKDEVAIYFPDEDAAIAFAAKMESLLP
jgi:hypothetical protein